MLGVIGRDWAATPDVKAKKARAAASSLMSIPLGKVLPANSYWSGRKAFNDTHDRNQSHSMGWRRRAISTAAA